MAISKEEMAASDTEIAKRPFAAYLSYAFGLKSMDRVYKRYAANAPTIGTEWLELARQARSIQSNLGIPVYTARRQ